MAYNLITRDGVGFQPGSRSYDQVWMRDGAVMGLALMRMGFEDAMRDFLDYFEKYQFENGEIPPIIDPKAEDPLWPETLNDLIEYDSQGQYVWAILSYYRFTGDREWLQGKSDSVIKALAFLEELRSERLTEEFRDDPEKVLFYGLLPPSDSHEGYKMKHSYWDDFWALKGWRDGSEIARILDDETRAAWCDQQYEALKDSTYASMERVMALHDLNRIPGCAELGDVDPPACAAMVDYCGELLDRWPGAVSNTFERFYQDFNARWTSPNGYSFGPYEVRTIPVLVQLDQRERAVDVLLKMLDSCRPLAWNHLAEVVRSGYRTPGYIGDMPHTWIGADLINAVCTLFAYDKDGQMILGHGLIADWILGDQPIGVSNLHTPYGILSYTIRYERDTLQISMLGKDIRSPARGFIFQLPENLAINEALVDGIPTTVEDNGIRFKTWPAHIEVRLEAR